MKSVTTIILVLFSMSSVFPLASAANENTSKTTLEASDPAINFNGAERRTTTPGTQKNSSETAEDKLLVFSKTAGHRHDSIKAGRQALIDMGKGNGFQVEATEDAEMFSLENLQQYSAVVFLNTTGDVLNQAQQTAFERYIQSGGGFVGVHAATDTEYEWPWYGLLVGAYFAGHPPVQEATLRVINKQHSSTSSLGESWQKTDEWYNFKSINPDARVLIEIDEATYKGGTNGDSHPISWYHDYDGGRAFYTAMGHAKKTYKDRVFLGHLLGGIAYAMGEESASAFTQLN